MEYQHQDTNGNTIALPLGKVVCVGRNYVAHAMELNNPVPSEPILFIKPSTSLVSFHEPIDLSQLEHDVHYEGEIAVLINKTLKNANQLEVRDAIEGLGLSLDLTFRDLQSTLKSKGHPWEKAKAFDKSCPTTQFYKDLSDFELDNLQFSLEINGVTRQSANSSQMILDIISLIEYTSRHFTLQPGDIVLTGTPSGVGKLMQGDDIFVKLDNMIEDKLVVI